jgi:DNA-binding response OmpR family regulator
MPAILLVEDDDDIRQIEADYLKVEKYTVFEAKDGHQALDLFADHQIDLVVLDLNLPVLDGVSVCRAIRRDSGAPIIMVTAKTSEIDELLGLEVGADDYVRKPFSPKILVARIKSLLKRPELLSHDVKLTQHEISLDVESCQVTKKGKPVNLTATQFNMLYVMMSHPGKVFSRDELIERGYGKDLPPDIFDRTIDSHVKNIRKALEDNPDRPEIILTVRGHGYKFANL